jgi:hypothetical protein
MLFNLRMDSFERAKESGDYPHRRANRPRAMVRHKRARVTVVAGFDDFA